MKFKKAIFAIELATEYKEKKNLNGFEIAKKYDLMEAICKDDILKSTIESKIITPRLFYNTPNDTLYLLVNVIFNSDLDANTDAVLYKTLVDTLFLDQEKYEVKFNEEIIELKPTTSDNIIYRFEESEMPKGFVPLNSVLKTEKDVAMYTDFMSNVIVFKRLKDFCIEQKINIKEDMTTTAMLPIHTKDPLSGILYIHKGIIRIFKEFQLAQNFVKGFNEGTPEYEIGKLMFLRPSFSFDMWNLITTSNPDKDLKMTKVHKFVKKCMKQHPILEYEIDEINEILK